MWVEYFSYEAPNRCSRVNGLFFNPNAFLHFTGSSLEQKSWLSKTYVVKAGSQGIALGTEAAPDGGELSADVSQPDAEVEGKFDLVLVRRYSV